MNKVELMEKIAQHTCPDCDGKGEVLNWIQTSPDDADSEVDECISCTNGYVE